MAKFNSVKGMQDWYGTKANQFLSINHILSDLITKNGYHFIKTPVLETYDLFKRSSGETSDIVNKELYDFFDKSNRHLVLRPEGTAGIARSVIENKLLETNGLPLKLWYFEPMYRYERPQSGRYREFFQFGCEIIGANSYYYDLENILLAIKIIQKLKLKNVDVRANYIGNTKSRSKWIEALKQYFRKYLKELSEDSQKRLETNPLRILDDKIDGQKDFVKNAVKINEFLTEEEKQEFDNITKLLKEKVPSNFHLIFDETLVRGLDYYNGLVFEINSKSEVLKGQPTIIGGGRYNKLLSDLGGNDENCVGFAIGIERLLIALNEENIHIESSLTNHKSVLLALLDETLFNIADEWREEITNLGYEFIVNYNLTKITKLLQYAKRNHINYIIIIGSKEQMNQKFILKDEYLQEEYHFNKTDLISFLKVNR